MESSKAPCKGKAEWNGEEQADLGAAEKGGKPRGAAATAAPAARAGPKYWECMRNHAAALGLHAFDGCGEFMPVAGGDPGAPEALRCAACGCHRNFHRRDHGVGRPCDHAVTPHGQHPLPHNSAAASSKHRPYYSFLQPPPHFPGHDRRSGGSATPPPRSPPPAPTPSSAPVGGVAQPRKRCRTMFTREQKDEMRKFAEKVGWSIQRHDGEELREFCARVGVRRHVLKVWMHNNKGARAGAGAGPSKGARAGAGAGAGAL